MKTTIIISGEQHSGKSWLMYVLTEAFIHEPTVAVSPDAFLTSQVSNVNWRAVYLIDAVRGIPQLKNILDKLARMGGTAIITTYEPPRHIRLIQQSAPCRIINLARRSDYFND